MKNIFIISGLKSLNRDECTTSSQIFELDLINLLIKEFRVVLLSNQNIPETTNGNLVVLKGPINFRNTLFNSISEYSLLSKNDIIINFGYDYLTFLQLKKLRKKFHCKLYSFIYDHHSPALSQYGFFKKNVLSIYFNLGIKTINSYDGILLFNEESINIFKIKTKVLVLKPFVSSDIYKFNSSKRIKTFLFAGTLNKFNCINELIDLFAHNPLLNLNICGYGPLKDFVLEACKINKNIKFYGTLNSKEIKQMAKTTDCFICFRENDKLVNKVSFPSKIVEYITYSKPIFTNSFSKEVLGFNPVIWVSCSTKKEDLQNTLNLITKYDFKENKSKFLIQEKRLLNFFEKNRFYDDLKKFIK